MSGLGWWDQYRGIPYTRAGCSHEGCGCWGLIVLIYREQLGIDLPPFSGVACASDTVAYDEAMGHRPPGWVQVERPSEFDVALFRVGRLFHGGVIFSPRGGWFLHVCKDISVTSERYKALAWRHRLAGFWRHEHAPN